jgi:lipoyl(octanoyl) transferase
MPEFIRVGFDPDFVDYQTGLDLQRKIHAEVAEGQRPNTVLLLEHSSVYTAGKRTDISELPNDGSAFFETDRGGKITWHGPGQLIGYPIMHLPQPIDVVGYVRFLEQTIIEVIADFGVSGIRVEGRSGVWVETEEGVQKLAAIGIRVAQKVTMHGFALNCENSLEPYDHIIACGIQDARTTTLSQICGRTISVMDAVRLIEKRMGEIPNARIKA